MTLKAGDKLPEATFTMMGADGPKPISAKDYFAGRRVALFSVPGAYTPTCSKQHLPGFIANAAAIKARGVDAIAVTAVNDAFVLDAWLEALGGKGRIDGLADGSAKFVTAIGLELDLTEPGLGVRGKRFSAVVKDGVVESLEVEDNSSACTVSSAESTLGRL